jgi:hypothetical protein
MKIRQLIQEALTRDIHAREHQYNIIKGISLYDAAFPLVGFFPGKAGSMAEKFATFAASLVEDPG